MNIPSLSLAQLALMRTTVNNSLPDLCNIVRNAPTQNGAGGYTPHWSNVYSNVACRFGPYRVPEVEKEDIGNTKVTSDTRWEFILPFGTDLLVTDRIQVVGGFLYEVASPRSPQSFGLHVFYICELIL